MSSPNCTIISVHGASVAGFEPLNQNYHLNAESGRPENVTPDVDVYMIDMGGGC